MPTFESFFLDLRISEILFAKYKNRHGFIRNTKRERSKKIIRIKQIKKHFHHQVPGKGLADAKLDRAPREPAQRPQDPDTQPVSRHQLRVPG